MGVEGSRKALDPVVEISVQMDAFRRFARRDFLRAELFEWRVPLRTAWSKDDSALRTASKASSGEPESSAPRAALTRVFTSLRVGCLRVYLRTLRRADRSLGIL